MILRTHIGMYLRRRAGGDPAIALHTKELAALLSVRVAEANAEAAELAAARHPQRERKSLFPRPISAPAMLAAIGCYAVLGSSAESAAQSLASIVVALGPAAEQLAARNAEGNDAARVPANFVRRGSTRAGERVFVHDHCEEKGELMVDAEELQVWKITDGGELFWVIAKDRDDAVAVLRESEMLEDTRRESDGPSPEPVPGSRKLRIVHDGHGVTKTCAEWAACGRGYLAGTVQ